MHSWKANVLQIIQSVFFVVLIWGTDRAITNSNERLEALRDVAHPESKQVGHIPDCKDSMFLRKDRECKTFLYSPKDDPVVARIVNGMMWNNEPAVEDDRVLGFDSMHDVDQYLLDHQETVLAAVHFVRKGSKMLDFIVQTNTSLQFFKGQFQHPTLYIQLPLQLAVEREVTRYITEDAGMEWDVKFTQFAHPASHSDSIMSTIAPTFLLASAMFNFVILLNNLVYEKESGVRQALCNMGMVDFAFWASWVVSEVITAVVHSLLVVGVGLLLNMPIFVQNNLFLVLALIGTANLALMSIAFLFSTALSHAGSAVPAGFSLFVVAWIMQMCIASGFPYAATFSNGSRFWFNCLPWTLLSKGFRDLARASGPGMGGITWSNRVSYCQVSPPSPSVQEQLDYWRGDCVVPLGNLLWYLVAQIVVYLVIAIYMDNILPDGHGVRKPLWYFLSPKYWWLSNKRDYAALQWALDFKDPAPGESVDEDVKMEMDVMKERCTELLAAPAGISEANPFAPGTGTKRKSKRPVLELFSLRKSFKRGIFIKEEFAAVHGTWLGVQEGECFCLLGPNGAGKTTTINCLTGVIPVTSGDALMYGESVRTTGGLNSIRSFMGVCPQFDILWDKLTGREHLQLFADIKGIPWKFRSMQIESLLEQVKLAEAGNLVAEAYSGGMRRRLSVAVALLGNPKVIFLDEPTTGMDPISRRHVWDLIDRAKKDRVIVLTTHSMEEADMLGDRIGIMARGRLRCLGNGLRLKALFGSGYRMSVRTDGSADSFQKLKAAFKSEMDVGTFEASEAYVHFLIPKSKEKVLANFMRTLKSRKKELHIQDVQLGLTPLEEVFLNVARLAELEFARVHRKYEKLIIAGENCTLNVPLGAESVKTPAGVTYFIRWGQDEHGALKLVDYCIATTTAQRRASWVKPIEY